MDETVLLLILAIVGIIFAIPYALAILLYTFPFFISWLLVPVHVGPEPPLIIDPSPQPQLAKLRAQKRAAENQYDEVRYSDWGIRWSDNLGRFEERSIRGRELNEQLGYWEAEADRIKVAIEEVEAPETRGVSEWTKSLRLWSQKHDGNAARRAAWKLALLVFFGVWIAAELIGMAFPGFIKFFAFAWNPAPDFLHPGMGLGALAGWAAGIYRVLHPPKLFAKLVHEKIREYRDAKEVREQAEDQEIAESSSEEPFEERKSFENEDYEEDEGQEEPWYDILGVSPNATTNEIKAAYREKIKQYHPDLVSGLGEKLRLLAKSEISKIERSKR